MSSEIKANKISPATGTAFTLGDSGDTFTVPSGVTLTNNGTASGFGGGKVLQVVQATKGDTASTTSRTAVTTGLEASITPSATSSKVLVTVVFGYTCEADVNSVFQLWRDSTAIHLADAAGNRERASAASIYQASGGTANMYGGTINALDTPSSTSSITYKLMYFGGEGANSNSIFFNRAEGDSDTDEFKRTISSITLMEIGA